MRASATSATTAPPAKIPALRTVAEWYSHSLRSRKPMIMRLLLALAVLSVTPSVAPVHGDGAVVALVADAHMAAPAAHGVERLRAALHERGFRVVDGAAAPADRYVLLSIDAASGCAESLSIAPARYRGRPALDLRGGDAVGLMYAALAAADRIALDAGDDPFAGVRQASEQPFLHERGVSMYTMQRALFEQKLYDETYWRKYFDLLADSRINTFVVIFGYENGGFMAPPYPYFFDTPGYPDVRLVGLTAEQQARNTAAFTAMIRLAHERGIKITAGIWDHIYRAGVQAGGIQGAAKGDAPTPGLVWGLTASNLSSYSKAAIARFLAVFPQIDGIQFRMHDESGLKPEEMGGFWHEVFAQIKATRPDLKLDLRAKGLPDAVIEDALSQGLDARISTKFWMEQMGLPFHPTHVNPQDQKNRRHGYADLLRYPQRYRVHWQLWTGGTARLLLWGDPDYVRRFASAAKLYGGDSFDVNEMLATKMLGEPHDAAPVAILNAPYRYYDYEFERYWYFYQLWGRLTYAPDTPGDAWDREFSRRFGAGAGPHVEAALQHASAVLPRIVAAAYRYSNFPTTRGWAEMQRQGSLPQFATLEGSDTEQFETPQAEARSVIDKTVTTLRRPQETAAWFTMTADAIDREIAAVPATGANAELTSTLTDCRILSGLARYYAKRLPAAVAYDIYKVNGDLTAFDTAAATERLAIDAWASVVAAAGDVYAPSLPFGARPYFPRHWREELDRMRADLDTLNASRPRGEAAHSLAYLDAEALPAGLPSAVRIDRAGAAIPGQDLPVTVRIDPTVPIRSVRLRYRHLTQYEDYQSVTMTVGRDGTFTAQIPGAFVTRDWDVMYFVEVITRDGGGRNYPDLDRDTPYVIVPIRR